MSRRWLKSLILHHV
jgi:hypothetical protein